MRRPLGSFIADQRGAASLVMLGVVWLLLLVGGLALDIANRHRAETTLQAVADMSAASAAIRLSEPLRLKGPRDVAYQTFTDSLGTTNMSDAWFDHSFQYARYDPETDTFVRATDITDADAVRVTLARSPVLQTGEPTLLLRMVGLSAWDIRVTSVARIRTMEALPCRNPVLSLQAGTRIGRSDLFAGICVLADVSLTSTPPGWLTDTAVDLIDTLLTSVVLPDVLRGPVAFLSHRSADNALADLLDEARPLRGNTFDANDLRADVSVRVSCPDSGVLSLRGPLNLNNVAMFSECPVRFDADVTLRSSLIVTNLKGLTPHGAARGPASDAHLMDQSACAPGDGARIYLFASADIAASIPLLDRVVRDGGVRVASRGDGGIGAGLAAAGALDLAGLAGICLGATAMVSMDRVSLH